jgi:hypothetical protein
VLLLPVSVLGALFSDQPSGCFGLIGLALYPVAGFVFGALMAVVYNMVIRLRFIGGLEVTLEQLPAEP